MLTNTNANTNVNTYTNKNANTNANTYANTNTNANTNVNTDANTNTNANTNVNIDANTNTNANTDANTNTTASPLIDRHWDSKCSLFGLGSVYASSVAWFVLSCILSYLLFCFSVLSRVTLFPSCKCFAI